MPTQVSLFQEVFQRISAGRAVAKVRKSSLRRLALLVTGLIAAKNVVLSEVANELLALKLTRATQAESIERTLRSNGRVCLARPSRAAWLTSCSSTRSNIPPP